MLQSLTPLREYNEKLSNPILRQFKTFEPDSTRRRGHFCKFPRLIFNSLPLCKIQSTLLPLFACISLVWSFPCTFVYKSLLIFYYAYVLHLHLHVLVHFPLVIGPSHIPLQTFLLPTHTSFSICHFQRAPRTKKTLVMPLILRYTPYSLQNY